MGGPPRAPWFKLLLYEEPSALQPRGPGAADGIPRMPSLSASWWMRGSLDVEVLATTAPHASHSLSCWYTTVPQMLRHRWQCVPEAADRLQKQLQQQACLLAPGAEADSLPAAAGC